MVASNREAGFRDVYTADMRSLRRKIKVQRAILPLLWKGQGGEDMESQAKD